jgi:histidyl-tRNA synthetase
MKPSLPKGTRDFGPVEMQRRNYIFDVIKSVYHKYGYLPLETPSMENLSTLTGKYGDEGDQLIFKILNSGDYLAKVDHVELQNKNSKAVLSAISEKALRYDLTVPFARYVVMHQHELVFPFKRYQIQPVWRADRPQKGRYREFYQCDADMIGSHSLMYEAELILMFKEVFEKLNLSVDIKVNNRKVISSLMQFLELTEKFVSVVTIIDKWDKIGQEAVEKELKDLGITNNKIAEIIKFVKLNPNNIQEAILSIHYFASTNEIGIKAIEELTHLNEYLQAVDAFVNNNISIDFTLVRGLNYYTGTIFEVKALNAEMGSICGGGRYDDLTGIFDLPGLSGVGISFGADRIYDVLLAKNLFPSFLNTNSLALFFNFGKKESIFSFQIIQQLRKRNFQVELYPDETKMKKQFQYAEAKNIPFVVLIGESEIAENVAQIKDLRNGEQVKVSIEHIADFLSKFSDNAI